MSGDYLDPSTGSENGADPNEGGIVEEAEFEATELPPAGDYDVVCIGADLGAKSKAGNPMIVLDLASPDCPAAAAKVYLVSTAAAKWRFDQGVQAFGLVAPTGTKKVKYRRTDFVGVKLRAKGVHDKNENFNGGQPTFKFDELSAAPEGAGHRVFGGEGN